MKNVEFKVEKNKLLITVDLTKEFGPSESGKTVIVASTSGNADTGWNGIRFGLNVFKRNPGFEKEKTARG